VYETDRLIALARGVQANAYCPYSGYSVGAAIIDEAGQVHLGCNVENVAYGSTLCAERAAVLAMIASGGREIKELALVTPDGGVPCGACLQVLAEFSPDPKRMTIYCSKEGADPTTHQLADLLPHTFASKEVRRTKPT
jgi:cytidine deaminase